MLIPDELNDIHRRLEAIAQELVKDGNPIGVDHDLVQFVNEASRIVAAVWERAIDKGYPCAGDEGEEPTPAS